MTYNAVMVGLSRVGKPYFRPYSRPLQIPNCEEADDHLKYSTLENQQIKREENISAVHPDSVTLPPKIHWKNNAITTTTDNEHSMVANTIDKRPIRFLAWTSTILV
jgi:hypothetical protein